MIKERLSQEIEGFPSRPEPKIVGPASLKTQEKYKKIFLKRFGEDHYKQLPKKEREILESLEFSKKPYEKSAIEKANEITNGLLEKFGLNPFDIPERNIHIIPGSLFEKIGKSNLVAITLGDQQAIYLYAEKLLHPIDKLAMILHEILHLKNALVIEAHEDLHKPYQVGLVVSASQKTAKEIGFFVMFKGLNEAVVTEMGKKYLPELLCTELLCSNEFLKEEYNWQNSPKAQKLKRKLVEKHKIEPEEIIRISKDGKDYNTFPYYEQRKVLNYLVGSIYEDNKDKFESQDKVMELFFKAFFDGRLLSIAKFIEKSFGKGAFRMVGVMDNDENSALQVMRYLKKRRQNNKR